LDPPTLRKKELVDMAKIVEAAKVNSTKKPCYRLWLTHLSILRVSKDA
jgi:hypothetical protein